jgi:hypothetical protein
VGLAACGVGVGAPWRCGAGGEPLSAPQRRCCGGVLRGYKRGAEGRVVDAAVVVFWQPIKRSPSRCRRMFTLSTSALAVLHGVSINVYIINVGLLGKLILSACFPKCRPARCFYQG